MKKITVLTVLLVCVVFAMPSNAKDVPKCQCNCVYRFVGFSDDATTGDAGGIQGMHALCQATFGNTARMCTTSEWMLSPDGDALPHISGIKAWIQPIVVVMSGSDVWDVTGRLVGDTGCGLPIWNCWGWIFDVPGACRLGAVLATSGIPTHVDVTSCSDEWKVTCCDVQ